jgi:hypothetical protein
MWDQHPMMKDWECMTDILLEAPEQDEDRKSMRFDWMMELSFFCFSTG